MNRRYSIWMASVLATACGGSSVHRLTDGGADAPKQADASRMTDAPADAPPAGAVTIAVTLDGAPAAGAIVYFQNADSSVVAELATGSDGTATQVMAPGGFVTLIEPLPPDPGPAPDVTGTPLIPQNQEIDTFSAVQPGDVLHVDLDEEEQQEQEVSFPITVPTDGSATDYELLTNCEEVDLGGGNDGDVAHAKLHANAVGPVGVTLDGCGSNVDMLVVTSIDGTILDTLYAPDVAVANDTAVTLTESYVPIGDQTVVDINIPAADDGPDPSHELIGPNGFLADSLNPSSQSDGTVAVVEYQQPDAAIVSDLQQFFEADGSGFEDDEAIESWGSAGSGTVIVDATAASLPDVAAAPTFDVGTQQVQWTQAGGGSVTIDGVTSVVDFSREVASGSGSGSGSGSAVDVLATWDWVVFAPFTGAQVVAFPSLPTDVFAWNGAAGDTISLSFFELGHAQGGYDAVIGELFDIDFDANDVSTPSGNAVMRYVFTQEQVNVAAAVRAVRRPSRGRHVDPRHARRTWRSHR